MMTADASAASPTSPYAQYLHDLIKELCGTGDDGFRIRLFVLLAVTALYTLLGLATLVLIFHSSCKRNGGIGIWLWKRVYLQSLNPNGNPPYLIVTNTKLALATCITLTGLYCLVYVAAGLSIYGYHHAPRFQFGLEFFLPHSICIAGWLVTFGNLQVAFLMHHDKSMQQRFVRLLNLIYVGLGGFWLVYLSALASVNTHYGLRYYRQASALLEYLRQHESAYTGAFDQIEADGLNEQVRDYYAARDAYGLHAVIEFASLPAFAVNVLLINLATIVVARELRSQLTNRVEHLKLFKGQSQQVHSKSLQLGVDSKVAVQEPAYFNETSLKRATMMNPEEEIKLASLRSNVSDERLAHPSDELSRPNTALCPLPNRAPTLSKREIRDIAVRGTSRPNTATRSMRPRTTEFPVNLDLEGDNRASVDEIDRSNALEILELDTTKKYVIAVGLTVAAAATASMGVTIYVSETVQTNAFFHNFTRFELTLYSFPYACALTLTPMMMLAFYLQWRQRTIAKVKANSRIEISRTVRVEFDR